MTDRLSFTDLTRLRDLAVENGDEYLLAAVDEAIARGLDSAGLAGELRAEQMATKDALAYSEWLKRMFIQPMQEERRVFWSRVDRAVGAIRGTGDPVARLQEVENILLEFDVDVDVEPCMCSTEFTCLARDHNPDKLESG